jgi:hypothetical protein
MPNALQSGVNECSWLHLTKKAGFWRTFIRNRWVQVSALGFVVCFVAAARELTDAAGPIPGVTYTNIMVEEVPWSIHLVRLERNNGALLLETRHANGGAIGMSPLSAQATGAGAEAEWPLAAVNGGFYTRMGPFAGYPRGLQIVGSELLSSPSGAASFWIDVLGEPHLDRITSQFEIVWPDGRKTPFGLNGECDQENIQLYTSAAGTNTHTAGCRDLILERSEGARWLPLRPGRDYTARVREARIGGSTPIAPGTLVLSIGAAAAPRFQAFGPGAILHISTATSPSLTGARTGLSAGPMLVHQGRPLEIRATADDTYEISSMLERHPRTAVGWNQRCYYLVQVDGRQKDLSVGMTLTELSAWLVKQGCEEALNLDGGGSSSLWFDGRLRSSPCDGYERNIANSVMVIRKPTGSTSRAAAAERSVSHASQ